VTPGFPAIIGRVMSYLSLSRCLEEQLATASPGDLVPSENELARLHQVNRLTARAALQELERRHLVRRIQGRGTFVVRRLDYRISTDGPASFTEIVRRAGGNPSTSTDDVIVRTASPAERRSLMLAPRAQVVELRRRRWLDDELVGVGISVLPAVLVPGLPGKLGLDGSLYRVLAEDYDLQPRRAWFRCEVEAAPEAVAEKLKLRGRPDLFHNCGRLESERLKLPVEINDGWLRTDVFNVVIEVGEFK
jgi:GntR family transcriptional regulator